VDSVNGPENRVSDWAEQNEWGKLLVGEVAFDQTAELLDGGQEEEERESVSEVAENFWGFQSH
jgi:hypothetical protein